MKKLVLIVFIASCISPKCAAQSIVYRFAGNGSYGFSGDGGPATDAKFGSTQGICSDSAGNVYIMDVGNGRVRKVNTAGIVTTVAGNGSGGYSGDGGPATGAGLDAYGIGCDAAGNILIGDWGNNRVRRVDAVTGIITTIAGNGGWGSSGDGGSALSAEISMPINAGFDLEHNIYICEYGGHKIRRVDAITGIITTVGGNGTAGYSGDGGPATDAEISSPCQTAVDGAGNIYIIDQGGLVRKINTGGIISTYAGGGSSSTGSGIPATNAGLAGPEGVAVDCEGNFVIADNDNNLMRKVDMSTGIITTVAGGGTLAVTVTGVPALSARFHNELDCFDLAGNLYITDDESPNVYKITGVSGGAGGSLTDSIVASPGDTVCPGMAVTFTAFSSNPVFSYQWYVDGSMVGTSLSTYTYYPSNGDSIRCVIIANKTGCSAGDTTVSSNTIGIVNSAQKSIVQDTTICRYSDAVIIILTAPASAGYIWNTGSTGATDTINTSGTYWVRYPDTSGCSTFGVDTFHVSVVPGPMPITGPYTICSGETLQLSDGTPGGTWTSGLPGIAAADSLSGTITGVSAGTATITYLLSTGCLAIQEVNILAPPCTNNVLQPAINNRLEIHPNPVSNELVLQMENNAFNSFTITNTIGQVMMQQDINVAETNVNVNALPVGLYYITLKGDNGSVVEKFVKMQR